MNIKGLETAIHHGQPHIKVVAIVPRSINSCLETTRQIGLGEAGQGDSITHLNEELNKGRGIPTNRPSGAKGNRVSKRQALKGLLLEQIIQQINILKGFVCRPSSTGLQEN